MIKKQEKDEMGNKMGKLPRERGMSQMEYFNENRPARLLAKYGITEDDYEILLASQQGRCGICGKSIFENGKLLAVDHDHLTGEIRGLLCSSCNLGIGLMEKFGFLKKALLYLGLRLSSSGEEAEK